MAKNIYNQIKERIAKYDVGTVFVTASFSDIATITTVRKCLGRLVNDEIIKRVIDGVYEKPKYSELLKKYIPTDPDKVAHALANNFHWTIVPSGDIALNKLGLSTQVPVVWEYVSDGPYREYSFDNTKIKFKHKNNKNISLISYKTSLIIEAIKTLEKDRINEEIIKKIKNTLSSDDKEKILAESLNTNEWILKILKEICKEDV